MEDGHQRTATQTACPRVNSIKESFDMKRAIYFASLMVVLTSFIGCASDCANRCPQRCGHACAGKAMPAGNEYPYYTTHGPRDFLQKNPQSIGP